MAKIEGIRFVSFTDDSPVGPMTCAYRTEYNNGITTIHMGFAFCSLKDRFNHDEGNFKAWSRLVEDPFIFTGPISNESETQMIHNLCRVVGFQVAKDHMNIGRFQKCKQVIGEERTVPKPHGNRKHK